MTELRIMYVCSFCADEYPEGCGHYDRTELRVMPDGRWLCESCFDDLPLSRKYDANDEPISFPHPPEFAPIVSHETSPTEAKP